MIKTQTRVSKVSFLMLFPDFFLKNAPWAVCFPSLSGHFFVHLKHVELISLPFCVSESSYSQNNTQQRFLCESQRPWPSSPPFFIYHRSPDFNCLSSHFYLGKNPDGWRISTLFERSEKKDRWGQGTSWKKAWMRGWARKECEPSCAKYLTLS